MVGLGNSCRGMKTPPLLVAALVACIVILGFNYWMASSHSVDLQLKYCGSFAALSSLAGILVILTEYAALRRILDLEGKVRRASAERGAVELKKNEFQGELEKQQQQINKIQSLHNFQMENANRVHQEEKAVLMSNITVNERSIQSLREHLKELQTEYGKLQLDVYWFQKNQTNLQRKFSYDLSKCINQVKELKDQCEERIDELTKKGSDIPEIKENKDFPEDTKKSSQAGILLPASKQPELKQSDLEQQKPDEDVLKAVPTVKKTDLLQAEERIYSLPDIRKEEPRAEEEKLSGQLKNPQDSLGAAAVHKEMLPESEKELNTPEDAKRGAGQDSLQLAAQQPASKKTERKQLLNYDAKQDDSLTGKADKQEHEALNQDKDVDYNLEKNEAESETEKQAALAGIENVQNPEDSKNHLAEQDEE